MTRKGRCRTIASGRGGPWGNTFSAVPLKKYGQNFLTSPAVARRIVDAAGLAPQDLVLEIGPGKGILTRLMAQKCHRVWAVEIDPRLAESLKACFRGDDKVRIITEDILKYDLAEIGAASKDGIKVVANLPYNISVPILEKLYRLGGKVSSMVVMVQREMAERISASPGSKDYGSLSVFTQCLVKVERLFNVSPGSFFPQPKVISSVVRMEPLKILPVKQGDQEGFFEFVRLCFSQRRKMLRSVLRGRYAWPEESKGSCLEIHLARRAEELSIGQLNELYRTLKAVRQ
jgi:16S rRNA (adenine1518-N6/adenine1519-N6)-dimethyltransferase